MSKLPPHLIKSLQTIQGFDEEAFVKVHQSGEQVTSIRLNRSKIKTKEQEDQLLEHLIASINHSPTIPSVPWCEAGKYLPKRPSFTFDPSFHGGAYYVQEASSMFLDFMLRNIYTEYAPERVLDLCAAPGGKSTLVQGRFPNSFIVANEVIKPRVSILAENVSKWGTGNLFVTNNDPKDFQRLPGFFDLMVVDAPCSGSGLFRKDVHAIDEWSEANVEMCSQRQKRILADSISSLKQNGFLIYCTCSYSKNENEDVCDWIVDQLQLKPVSFSVPENWNIVETYSSKHNVAGYRFYPDKVKGEGFFVACFQQTNAVDNYYSSYPRLPSITNTESNIIAPYIDVNTHSFIKQKDTIIAFEKKHLEDVSTIQKALSVRKSGTAVGTIKGKDLIPHHELALSTFILPNVPYMQLEYEAAIQYLKRHDLQKNIDEKGWMLARFHHLNLGWMKVLPNRINNYYPTEWRILKH